MWTCIARVKKLLGMLVSSVVSTVWHSEKVETVEIQSHRLPGAEEDRKMGRQSPEDA